MKIIIECILAITIFIILFVPLLKVLVIILDMNSAVDRDQYLQLKFSQFKKFYAINPSSYKLHDYVASKGGICVIKFNLIDTLRYIHFKEQIEKNKANERMDNRMKEYLCAVQHDIDELNQEAQEAMEKAKREVGE